MYKRQGDTLTAALTGLGDISDRVKRWGTVKSDPSLSDTAATLMTEETDGLTRVNGAAYTTTTDGSITVTDAVSYTHLRAHEPVLDLVCRLLLEKKTSKATQG